MTLDDRLRGIRTWAMVPTPFAARDRSVDHASLRTLVAGMAADGCEGFIALGVIAEPATLTASERIGILESLRDGTDAPVVAAVMSLDEAAAAAEAEHLWRQTGSRLDGLMVPVSTPDGGALRTRLRDLHRRTGARLVLQDLPQATGIAIDVHVLADALDGLDFVDAVKCECPPTFTRIAVLAERDGRTLISGLGGMGLVDDLLEGATAAAIGVTRPATVVAAMDAWAAGDRARARALVAADAPLFSFETQQGQSVAIRKEHWRRRGLIASAAVREPTLPWTPGLDRHSRLHGYAPA
jgi:4-hydroxy-tetrahydrodipicolinate synthase